MYQNKNSFFPFLFHSKMDESYALLLLLMFWFCVQCCAALVVLVCCFFFGKKRVAYFLADTILIKTQQLESVSDQEISWKTHAVVVIQNYSIRISYVYAIGVFMWYIQFSERSTWDAIIYSFLCYLVLTGGWLLKKYCSSYLTRIFLLGAIRKYIMTNGCYPILKNFILFLREYHYHPYHISKKEFASLLLNEIHVINEINPLA